MCVNVCFLLYFLNYQAVGRCEMKVNFILLVLCTGINT